MSTEVGRIHFTLDLDDRDFKTGLKSSQNEANTFSSGLEGLNKKLDNIADRMMAVGKKATVGLTLPIVGLGAAAVKAFSDLGEAVNASNVTFGNASKALQEFAETAARSVGLSKRAFLEASTPIGAMLQNMGFNADQAAQETIKLTKRAADLASVFNVDVKDALTAVTSGIRGETEPIRRFGADLSETAIRAHAVAKGLIESDREMTQNEKVAARLSLMYEQTNKVAGDFANTSDSIANKQRILKADAENTAASFGEKLQPAMDKLLTVLGKLLDKFNALSPGQQDFILKAALVLAVIGPLTIAIGGLVTAIRGIVLALSFVVAHPVILAITVAILAIAGLAYLVIHNWDTLKGWFLSLFEWFKANWDKLLVILIGPFGLAIGWIVRNWDTIKNVFSSFKGWVGGVLSGVYDAITSPFRRAFDWIKDKVDDVKRALNKLNPLARFSPSLVDQVKTGTDRITSLYGNMFNTLTGMSDAVRPNLSGATNAMGGGAGGTTNNFPGNIVLTDASAVDRLFERLDRNQDLESMGLSPV